MPDRFTKRKKRISNKELFLIQKKILILIFNENKELLNKNKIYNKISKIGKEEHQTGLRYKQNILDSIDAIAEMGLVKRDEEGKQKENIKLTPIGQELSDFICTIENYNLSYFNLIKTIHKKVSFIFGRDIDYIEKDNDELDHLNLDKEFKEEISDMKLKLIDNGWKEEEIKLYNKIRTTLIDFKVICDNNFINILLSRYSRIIKIHNEDNLLLLNFLHYLIKVSVEKKIDFMLENYESEIFGYSTIRIIYPNITNQPIIVHQKTGNIYQYFLSLYNIFYDQMIAITLKKEVEDMLSAYLELLQVPMEIDMLQLGNLKQLIKKYEYSAGKVEEKVLNIEKTKIDLKRKTACILFESISNYNRSYRDKPKRSFWVNVPFHHH